MAVTEPIRNKKQVKELSEYYLQRGKFRNHVLIIMGIHTALRISDLLLLKWEDVFSFDFKYIKESIRIKEKKTGKYKTIILNKKVIQALNLYIKKELINRNGFLFENMKTGKAISRIQAYRIIKDASEALKWQNHISCHSLRKTFGYHAWKNGVPPTVIMDIYNHSSFEVTRRYLGVTQDDKNEVYLCLAALL